MSQPSGTPSILPGVSGINNNLRVSDPAFCWEADQVEPCISAENKENDLRNGHRTNTAFNVLSCVGTEATIVMADAK